MDEFAIIEKLFRPLTMGEEGALNLKDDAAFLNLNGEYVVTTDTIVEGTHFNSQDAIETIGGKLVRINLSDVYAKGALPIAGFLNIAWNPNFGKIDNLVNGIKSAIGLCEFPILGGDTTATKGNIVLSMTIIARPHKKMVTRHNANIGDKIYATGTIGRAYLGLNAIKQSEQNKYPNCVSHYLTPQIPHSSIARVIADFATSSLDCSDGLLGDVRKLCQKRQSVSLSLDEHVFCEEILSWLVGKEDDEIIRLLSFGDDYQSLFSIAPHLEMDFKSESKKLGLDILTIGEIIDGEQMEFSFMNRTMNLDNQSLSFVHKI